MRAPDGTEYIIELTVPWEENFESSNQRKRTKYAELLLRRKLQHRNTHLIVFEVGARGKPSDSCKELNLLFGGDKTASSDCRQSMVREAIRGSFDIWMHRENPTWTL